jgi:hypothetical protein
MNYPGCPQCRARGKARLYWQAPGFSRCDECGAMYWDPFSDAASLADLYYEGWKSPISNTRETGATDVAIASTFVGSVVKTLGGRSLAGMRVLDYGAGRAAVARELDRRGGDVVAVEPFGCDDVIEPPPTVILPIFPLHSGSTGSCVSGSLSILGIRAEYWPACTGDCPRVDGSWLRLAGRGLTPGVARYIRRSPRLPVSELVPVG